MMTFTAYHIRSGNDRGKPAFYVAYEKMPEVGDAIKAKDAFLLNFDEPDPHTAMVCGSCGEEIKWGMYPPLSILSGDDYVTGI